MNDSFIIETRHTMDVTYLITDTKCYVYVYHVYQIIRKNMQYVVNLFIKE